jgi:two-component system response regulator
LLQNFSPGATNYFTLPVNYRQLVAAADHGLVLDIAPLSDTDLAFYVWMLRAGITVY